MSHFLSPNSILIQGVTPMEFENMISRLLDKKLAVLIESTPQISTDVPSTGLYRRKEAADKLRVSLVTLGNWTKLGIINARRIGARVYYTDSDINNALKKVSKE